MPIYEYGCKKCKKTFEYTQRISDPPKKKCEACGRLSLERLISQTSFLLKGSGWYKDLYSSPKPSGDGGGDGAAAARSEATSGGAEAGAGPATDKPAASGSADKPAASGSADKPAAATDQGKKPRAASPAAARRGRGDR